MSRGRNPVCAALLVGMFLGLAAGSAATDGVLSIKGDRFVYGGEPFDMWGIRTASGTMDDDQCEHLIAQFDDYLAHGVNTVTVFYMGCRGGNYDPFSPDGRRVDPGHQERMERIIRAAAEREMVVVAGIFYQHAPFGLESADAVRNATRVVTASLKPYRNVIINICNEQNSYGWSTSADVFDFREPERVIELCRLVKQIDPERIVGGGGYDHEKNRVIGRSDAVDVLLFDTSSLSPDSGELYDRFVAAGVRDKPIVNVELYGGLTNRYPRGIFRGDLRKAYLGEVDGAAARPGLSIFFHNCAWCQTPPMRYDLAGDGREASPGIRWYFEAIRDARAAAGR
jgi:hypothetical protein